MNENNLNHSAKFRFDGWYANEKCGLIMVNENPTGGNVHEELTLLHDCYGESAVGCIAGPISGLVGDEVSAGLKLTRRPIGVTQSRGLARVVRHRWDIPIHKHTARSNRDGSSKVVRARHKLRRDQVN